MNTGFVRPAVGTTPTACGIETNRSNYNNKNISVQLEQHLPLAVLKLIDILAVHTDTMCVGTTPTACGIETF